MYRVLGVIVLFLFGDHTGILIIILYYLSDVWMPFGLRAASARPPQTQLKPRTRPRGTRSQRTSRGWPDCRGLADGLGFRV